MNVEALLDIERRTGIKNEDIDEFMRKASDIQTAIKGLMDGTLNPEDVKIEGIETDEERQKKEAEQAEKRRLFLEKEEKLRIQRKQQEKERWWSGAEAFKPRQTSESTPLTARQLTEEEEDRRNLMLSRYTADYSRWGQWAPSDEVSRQEEEERQHLEEDLRNQEFERNNPEFCQQFLSDMEQRKKASQQKQESADVLRLKGNRHFKAKDYKRALEIYMEGLKSTPFDAKLLLNIAQAHIKLRDLEEGGEFLERALYLEPHSVKALSRKAFVLGEAGQVDAALRALAAALQLEPGNSELLAQQKELISIRTEHEQENRLSSALSKFAVSEHSSTSAGANIKPSGSASSPAGSRKGSLVGIDVLRSLLQARCRDATSADFDVLDGDGETINLQRAYMRQSGTLLELMNYTKLVHEQGDSPSSLSMAIALLARSIDEQRSSKILFVESKLYSSVCKPVLSAFSLDKLDIIGAVLCLVYVLVYDDHGCMKAKHMVLQDQQVYEILSEILGNVSNHFFQDSRGADTKQSLTCMETTLSILKALCSDAASQDVFSSMSIMTIASIVCSVGSTLYALLHAHSKNRTDLSEDMLDAFVEKSTAVLLALSHKETVRRAFTYPLPLASTSSSSGSFEPVGLSTVRVLLQLAKTLPHHQVNVISILMNASLPAKEASEEDRCQVSREIYQHGGLDIALPSHSKGNEDVLILQHRVRKGGLLTRLAMLPDVQQFLLHKDTYRTLCRNLCNVVQTLATKEDGEMQKWMDEERATYVRILASLPLASHAGVTDLLAVGREEHILESLLSAFPTPRMECNEITPASVVLMPLVSIQPMLLGNAARCLIPYIDDVSSAKVLFSQKKHIAVEKMVCAMASCTDLRVRKNMAILLAKACKGSAEVRERVSFFRGLQMMIELQSQL